MDKISLEKSIRKTKTTIQLEKLIIEIFEEESYERSNKGFESFSVDVGRNIRNVIAKSMRKGIIELLEDHYKL